MPHRDIALFAGVLSAVCACSHPSKVQQRLTAPGSCPGIPGVVPDDGKDDRPALQAAIDALPDAGGDLCLPAGKYDFTRPPGNRARANWASIEIAHKSHVTLRGVGPQTRLAMLGDGAHNAWALIRVHDGSSDVAIQDLSLEGAARTNTGEQTHLLLIGDSQQTRVENVAFDLPALGFHTGGDCVRLLGNRGAEVRDVTLRKLTGTACERSFVGVQRGVIGVVLEDSTSVVVGDQAVDFEPSGDGDVANFKIVHNRFARGPDSQGGFSVALSGGRGIARNIDLSENELPDGGLMIMNVDGVHASKNTVIGARSSPRPVVLVMKDAANVDLVDNTIKRAADTTPGPVVVVRHHADAAPRNITIQGGELIQETDGNIINAESVSGLDLEGVRLQFDGPSRDNFVALEARGVIRGIDQVKMKRCTVAGALRAVAHIGSKPDVTNGSIEIDVTADGPGDDVTFAQGQPANAKVRVLRDPSRLSPRR